MSKAIFKADPRQGGFIRATIAPIDLRQEPRFGTWDAVEIVSLIIGVVLVMRYLLR